MAERVALCSPRGASRGEPAEGALEHPDCVLQPCRPSGGRWLEPVLTVGGSPRQQELAQQGLTLEGMFTREGNPLEGSELKNLTLTLIQLKRKQGHGPRTPKEQQTITEIKTCLSVVAAALFTTAERWKWPHVPR